MWYRLAAVAALLIAATLPLTLAADGDKAKPASVKKPKFVKPVVEAKRADGDASVQVAPANDLSVNAVRLTCSGSLWTATNAMTTCEATDDVNTLPLCTCCNSGWKGVWYYYESTAASNITVSTCSSSYDTVLKVYSSNNYGAPAGTSPTLTTCRASNDDLVPPANSGLTSCFSLSSLVTVPIPARTRVYFLVTGFAGSCGSLRLHCKDNVATSPPANDRPSGAVKLSCASTSWGLSSAIPTCAATDDNGYNACTQHSSYNTKGVWYYWEDTVARNITVATCRSSFDTVLKAYASTSYNISPGNNPTITTCAASSDDRVPSGETTCASLSSTIDIVVPARTRYYFMASGFSGCGTLQMQCKGAVMSTAPTNDRSSGAAQLTCGSGTFANGPAISTCTATDDTGTPACSPANNYNTKGVWYYYQTGAAATTVTVTTCLSTYDTVLRAFQSSSFGLPTGSTPTLTSCMGSSDDLVPTGLTGCNTLASTVTVTIPANTRFYFLATGYSGCGNLVVSCKADTVTPPPPGGYSITLINVGTNTSQDATFQAAKARWESIIRTDVPDFPNPSRVDLSAGIFNGFSYTGSVDDIAIFYRFTNIDGRGNVLGRAGWTYARSSPDLRPIAGIMEFDSSDIGTTISQAEFRTVVLHEMAHVLGVGTVWGQKNCTGPCTPGSGATVNYLCPEAQREFNTAGCLGSLPIETTAGPGSGCSHWMETRLGIEIMTPYIGPGSVNPLSRITIGAIADIYGANAVDYSQADSFSCTAAAPAGVSKFINTTLITPRGLLG